MKQLTDELAFNSAGKDIPELQQFSSVLLHEWKGGYWWKDFRSIVLGRSIVLAVGSNALKLPLAKRSEMAEILEEEILPQVENEIQRFERKRSSAESRNSRKHELRMTKYFCSLAIPEKYVDQGSGQGVERVTNSSENLVINTASNQYDVLASPRKKFRFAPPVPQVSFCDGKGKLWVTQGQIFAQIGLHRFKLVPRKKKRDSLLRREALVLRQIIDDSMTLNPFTVLVEN